eukprot:6276126-Pyramimonas_sp.AAC.1
MCIRDRCSISRSEHAPHAPGLELRVGELMLPHSLRVWSLWDLQRPRYFGINAFLESPLALL